MITGRSGAFFQFDPLIGAVIVVRMQRYCKAKTELLVGYQKAASTYSKAVAELSHYAGTIPQVEYNRLSLMTARARKACREAREALHAHLAEHQCS